MRALKWLIGAVVAVAILVVGGTWVYINLIRDEAPERLTFEDAGGGTTVAPAGATTVAVEPAAGATTAPAASAAAPTTAAGAGAAPPGIDGTWTVTPASQLGYRVKEILFGQSTEGVGRTNAVTGSLTIAGTTVTAADFSVEMATLTSDEDRRDSQFRGRIMDTDTYPTATFVLTQPIELGSVPADLQEVNASATGDLTLRGTTKPVTLDAVARRNGATIEVNGSVEIVFEEWGIPNPDTGPIDTEDQGLLEFVFVFAPAPTA